MPLGHAQRSRSGIEGTRTPFRVGIWCDYGHTTILGYEGIGVFLLNLVEGLIDLDEEIEIVLLVADGDQDSAVVSALVARARGRLRALPERARRPRFQPPRVSGLMRRWIRSADRARTGWRDLAARLAPIQQECAAGLERRLDRCVQKARAGDVPTLAAGALAGPPAFMAAWGGYTGWHLSAALAKGMVFPVRAFDDLVRRVNSTLHLPEDRPLPEAVRGAGCDAWLIPYVGQIYHLPPGSVLVIHDLMHLRFPDLFPPEFARRLRALVPRRAAEAALCATMAELIRDHDLVGALGLPIEKTRVVRPAAPADLPAIGDELADRLIPVALRGRSFLLYPAAVRPYKNHRALIEALRELRDRGEDRFDLVLTGNRELPPDLAGLIDRSGLEGRVHRLGYVDRSVLAALYARAFATIVPSFHEEVCFPIYEALRAGCPVACSRIAPFLEHYGGMGDAMLFFDPEQPREIADVVLAIKADRAGIRERQRAASRPLRERTWDDAAREWLAVLEEAAELARAPVIPAGRRLAIAEPGAGR